MVLPARADRLSSEPPATRGPPANEGETYPSPWADSVHVSRPACPSHISPPQLPTLFQGVAPLPNMTGAQAGKQGMKSGGSPPADRRYHCSELAGAGIGRRDERMQPRGRGPGHGRCPLSRDRTDWQARRGRSSRIAATASEMNWPLLSPRPSIPSMGRQRRVVDSITSRRGALR